MQDFNKLTREELVESLLAAHQTIWEQNRIIEVLIRESQISQNAIIEPLPKIIAHRIRDAIRRLRGKN